MVFAFSFQSMTVQFWGSIDPLISVSPSYNHTMVQQKETKWSRLDICFVNLMMKRSRRFEFELCSLLADEIVVEIA